MSQPTVKEVRAFLSKQIDDWKSGWTDFGAGKVTDKNALHAIACLRAALKQIKVKSARRLICKRCHAAVGVLVDGKCTRCAKKP